MPLTLVPVTPENRNTAEALEVFPEQRGFIETVKECMAEADSLSLWHPVCICKENTAIGFAMYGYWHENGTHRLWFDRLLIDRHFQHCGYGKEAVLTVLKHLRREYPGEDIYLSVYEDNLPAKNLYLRYGFAFNGELDINGEKVMVLPGSVPLPE